jgi:glutaredoxin
LSDEEVEEGIGVFIDFGSIVIDAVDRHRILDDESVASMKSTAEAKMRNPEGWDSTDTDNDKKEAPDEDKDTIMTDKAPSPPSTLSSTTQVIHVEKMSQEQLEKFMKQASERLQGPSITTPTTVDLSVTTTIATPSQEDGGNK